MSSKGGPVIIRPKGASVPIPIGQDLDLAKVAETHLQTIAQDMYDGDDPKYEGMTRLEVAILSLARDAATDPDARKEFLDRSMGKPRQRVDSMNVNVTLQGFLEQLADEDDNIVDAAPRAASSVDEAKEMFS